MQQRYLLSGRRTARLQQTDCEQGVPSVPFLLPAVWLLIPLDWWLLSNQTMNIPLTHPIVFVLITSPAQIRTKPGMFQSWYMSNVWGQCFFQPMFSLLLYFSNQCATAFILFLTTPFPSIIFLWFSNAHFSFCSSAHFSHSHFSYCSFVSCSSLCHTSSLLPLDLYSSPHFSPGNSLRLFLPLSDIIATAVQNPELVWQCTSSYQHWLRQWSRRGDGVEREKRQKGTVPDQN